MVLQLAITLQPCELPLGLTVVNVEQETLHLITFPAMDHLLRMWKVTSYSPQPQETWRDTGLCLLGKCSNHKHSTKIGVTTSPHPGAAAGIACKKRTRWLSVLEWVTHVPKFWNCLQSTASSFTLAYYSGWVAGKHLSPWEWQGCRWIPLFSLFLLAVLWALVLCVQPPRL